MTRQMELKDKAIEELTLQRQLDLQEMAQRLERQKMEQERKEERLHQEHMLREEEASRRQREQIDSMKTMFEIQNQEMESRFERLL